MPPALLCSLAAAIACAGCSFAPVGGTPSDARGDGAVIDTPIDVAPQRPAWCAPDPHLRLCFSFDGPTLPAMLADEGVAQVSARLTNVTPTAGASSASGTTTGAALLGATSQIYVPSSSQVTNIQSAELWFRIDTDPANGGRSGLYDSNATPLNISLFFYRTDPGRQLRCGLGGQVEVWTIPSLPTTVWHHAACVCNGGSLAMYLDGAIVGPARQGTCASGGGFVSDGFTIGSDNTGNPDFVADRLLGAIDGIRLWDVTLSAATVCAHAGGITCQNAAMRASGE